MVLAQMVEIGEMVELVAFHRSEQWLHDEVEVSRKMFHLKKNFVTDKFGFRFLWNSGRVFFRKAAVEEVVSGERENN